MLVSTFPHVSAHCGDEGFTNNGDTKVGMARARGIEMDNGFMLGFDLLRDSIPQGPRLRYPSISGLLLHGHWCRRLRAGSATLEYELDF